MGASTVELRLERIENLGLDDVDGGDGSVGAGEGDEPCTRERLCSDRPGVLDADDECSERR